MALLTAEDVLNKAFSKTKYREGFDQDEVDDFLDEVANTIAQLTAERDEAVARAGSGTGSAPVAIPEAPLATAAGGVPGTTGLLAAATDPGAANPSGMLAMAQKLHDEYVQAGEAERDRIIDEAHASADQIRERADGDAKARMDDLAGERADLEGRIDDLRRFERDYRARLKSYLENLLGDLDHAGVAGAAGFAATATEMLGDDVDDAPLEDAAGSEATAAHSYSETDNAPESEPESEPEPETEVVIVDEYESAAPVSFDEALNGGFAPASDQPVAFEPATTPPSFDVSQPWESQLRAQDAGESNSNPFAPVTQHPAEESVADSSAAGDVPEFAASEESEETPFTPPSSRMFNDLYGQTRPDEGN